MPGERSAPVPSSGERLGALRRASSALQRNTRKTRNVVKRNRMAPAVLVAGSTLRFRPSSLAVLWTRTVNPDGWVRFALAIWLRLLETNTFLQKYMPTSLRFFNNWAPCLGAFLSPKSNSSAALCATMLIVDVLLWPGGKINLAIHRKSKMIVTWACPLWTFPLVPNLFQLHLVDQLLHNQRLFFFYYLVSIYHYVLK